MILNETRHPAIGASMSPERKQRIDLRTRDLVNQAIASVPTLGLQRAAEFLATMNVPAEVAVRVLVYPQLRRTM